MDRRTFLLKVAVGSTALLVQARAGLAQDVEYLQALERAQRDRPRELTATGRIAPVGEPGALLVIHGQVFRADGTTPAASLIVFAYHTDSTGLYNVRSAGPHSWRLRGWTKTDASGRFEFRTIRPAPYPNGRTAAHVHFTIEGPGVPRQPRGLLFEGDPLLSTAERQASEKAGRFGTVLPVASRKGEQNVTLNMRVD